MDSVSGLIGLTLSAVEQTTNGDENDAIRFTLADGRAFDLGHRQGCCESVGIEDIAGDLADLVGWEILHAEETVSEQRPEGMGPKEYPDDSETWTLYRFATIKGDVSIRFWGSSNGYYSESVDFQEVTP